jgi:hypothetical protein
MFHRERNIEKNIDRLFGENADENFELREILKMSLTGKVDHEKLKELEDYRRKDLEFIYKNFELNEPVIINRGQSPLLNPIEKSNHIVNGETSTSKSD